jgi:hypothetical protein
VRGVLDSTAAHLGHLTDQVDVPPHAARHLASGGDTPCARHARERPIARMTLPFRVVSRLLSDPAGGTMADDRDRDQLDPVLDDDMIGKGSDDDFEDLDEGDEAEEDDLEAGDEEIEEK